MSEETPVNMDANWDAAELAGEAERETVMRELAFARRVAAGTMRLEEAERRIAMMREIARRLRQAAEAENRQGRLF